MQQHPMWIDDGQCQIEISISSAVRVMLRGNTIALKNESFTHACMTHALIDVHASMLE